MLGNFTGLTPDGREIRSVGNVPCGGCTRCCHGDAVRLLPGDDQDRYQTAPHPFLAGARMLAHAPNGDCVYLGTDAEGVPGCTIHDHRPLQCREMDCRLLAASLNYTQARKLAGKRKIPLAVWSRGRELLKGVAS
jgi:hypothetical protein